MQLLDCPNDKILRPWFSFLSPSHTKPQGSFSWCFSPNLIPVLKQAPFFTALRKCFDPIPVIPNIIPFIWSKYCLCRACTHRGRKNAVFDVTDKVNCPKCGVHSKTGIFWREMLARFSCHRVTSSYQALSWMVCVKLVLEIYLGQNTVLLQ